MSSSPPTGSALLACTRDTLLAQRSGYHVIADYLPGAEWIATPRCDPAHPLKLLGTRLLRRMAFSRWYAGGSFVMERQIRRRLRQGFTGPVHLLWCDRDMGFTDLLLDPAQQPLVGTFHQCVDELPHIIRRPSALKKFAAIILMSETQRPYFLAQGVANDRLHRILHGVDTDHFTPAETPPTGDFIALSVGGTRRDFAMTKTVAESLQNQPNLRFVIVGPEDRRPLFTGLPTVTYLSKISDAALLDHYRSASCYLHLADGATANNALLEGLSCGLPIITQQVGGIPEYISPDCATLCPPQNAQAVVQALLALARSPHQSNAMRHAARAHALTLDWRHVAHTTQLLYQSLN